MKKYRSDLSYEEWLYSTALWCDGKLILCGLDEAGRGPLAGPVVAGACILPDDFPVELLNDSKKLTEKKRLAIEPVILEKAVAWGIGEASHEEIDEINILNASLLAMKRAFEAMCAKLEEADLARIAAVADGIYVPEIKRPCRAEVKADGRFPCVMAASILAKNHRDRIMVGYDKLYPEYGYARHKGYPCPEHKEICRKIGPSPIQRRTFKY